MLNKEKFKDEIMEIVCSGEHFALKNGEVVGCCDTRCQDCDFGSDLHHGCTLSRKNWANSEYEEYVDWSKVPVDTKILVRDNENASWAPRHFAGVAHGCIYAFSYGRTSFTCNGKGRSWKYAKLYKEEEECTK